MKSQILELASAIPNPKRDKRKKGLPGLAEFPAGRYVYDGGTIHRADHSRYSDQLDRYTDARAIEFIVANATPVEPQGIRELLLAIDWASAPELILGLLLRRGVVTVEQIKDAGDWLDNNEY